MLDNIKQQVLSRMRTVKKDEIVDKTVYKCGNDGLVCFNGMVAEIVNGEYDIDDVRQKVEDRIYDNTYDEEQNAMIDDKRDELSDAGLNDTEVDNVINRMLMDGQFDDVNIDPYLDDVTDDVEDELADYITGDLYHIYENTSTMGNIDKVHVSYCNGEIDFDTALGKVIDILEQDVPNTQFE